MCIWGELSVPLEFFLLVSLWHLWGSVPQQDFMGPHPLSGLFWDQGGPPRSICQSVSLAVRLVPLASHLASCPFPPFIAPLRLKKKNKKEKETRAHAHQPLYWRKCARHASGLAGAHTNSPSSSSSPGTGSATSDVTEALPRLIGCLQLAGACWSKWPRVAERQMALKRLSLGTLQTL